MCGTGAAWIPKQQRVKPRMTRVGRRGSLRGKVRALLLDHASLSVLLHLPPSCHDLIMASMPLHLVNGNPNVWHGSGMESQTAAGQARG